jgi:hypothetical protein
MFAAALPDLDSLNLEAAKALLSQIEQLELQLEELQAANAIEERDRSRGGRSAHRRQALPQTAAGASATRDPYPYAGP